MFNDQNSTCTHNLNIMCHAPIVNDTSQRKIAMEVIKYDSSIDMVKTFR